LRTCYSLSSTLRVLAAAGAVCAVASLASAQDTGTQPANKPKVVPQTGATNPGGMPNTGIEMAKPVTPPPAGGFDPRGVPPNDACASAIAVGVGITPYDNLLATLDGPSPCGLLGADVWFSFTPAVSGQASVTTCSANRTYDTVLAVHTGGCGALALVGCNDDGPPSCPNAGVPFSGSTVNFAATAGTTYLLQVGGFNSATGSSDLTVSLVTQDSCAGAVAISGASGTVATSTVGQTPDAPAGCFATPDIWFAWTAPPGPGGSATFSFCPAQGGSAGYDTVLSMHTACGAAASACNDDFCGLSSSITFAATGSTTYLIRVAGFSGTGTGTMGWSFAGGPCITPPAGGIAEGEPCGTDTNGGCNSIPPIFSAISIGDTILGNAWASGGTRDTDWYQVTTPSNGTLTWRGAGQMPFRLFILTGVCPTTVIATVGGAHPATRSR